MPLERPKTGRKSALRRANFRGLEREFAAAGGGTGLPARHGWRRASYPGKMRRENRLHRALGQCNRYTRAARPASTFAPGEVAGVYRAPTSGRRQRNFQGPSEKFAALHGICRVTCPGRPRVKQRITLLGRYPPAARRSALMTTALSTGTLVSVPGFPQNSPRLPFTGV